jgi:hypothetical protein
MPAQLIGEAQGLLSTSAGFVKSLRHLPATKALGSGSNMPEVNLDEFRPLGPAFQRGHDQNIFTILDLAGPRIEGTVLLISSTD